MHQNLGFCIQNFKQFVGVNSPTPEPLPIGGQLVHSMLQPYDCIELITRLLII